MIPILIHTFMQIDITSRKTKIVVKRKMRSE